MDTLFMLNYPFDYTKIRGKLIERINRFVVRVDIEGQVKEAYLANPGRLWELMLPGTELLLSPDLSKGKIPYTVLACRKEGQDILLHTHLTNKVVRSLIDDGKLPAFQSYRVVKEEPAYGRHRFDLLLENMNTGEPYYLEIKSNTLFDGKVAMFPDAVTGRGANHLKMLQEIVGKGIKTGCLFVVMNPGVSYFMPAYHIDYFFAQTFVDVRSDVELQAVALGFEPNFSKISSVRPVTIPLEFLQNELLDRGVYLLLINVNGDKTLTVGNLGGMTFKQGYYVYVGSAMNTLSKRIARHKRKRKKKRWHIDYLSAEASTITAVPIITGDRLECELAAGVNGAGGEAVMGFGCSDCHCHSHLYYFKENPLFNASIIELIQHYRIGRLEKKLITT